MPTFSRQQLRRTLGQSHVRDTYVGSVTGSTGLANFSLNILDAVVADLRLSGQNRYVGAWLFHTGPAGEIRVASFNCGSGAYVAAQNSNFAGNYPSGMEYERHEMLSPTDKNRAIDDAVKRLRVRREVALPTVEGLTTYTLDGAASPHTILEVLDAYYFADPASSLDRDHREVITARPVTTATGWELRIDRGLAASQQLVLDAVLALTLGAADTATVNIPDERLVLYGAEAKCWDLVARQAPRAAADEYRKLRDEAARAYAQLAARFKVPVDRPVGFEEPF
jgi:hypothetical protein